jgi:hypothetical protein
METLEFVFVFVSLIQFWKLVKGTLAQIVVIIIIIIIIIINNYYHLFIQDVFFVGHPYLKVPSHQIRLCLKCYGWIGLDEYKDRGW